LDHLLRSSSLPSSASSVWELVEVRGYMLGLLRVMLAPPADHETPFALARMSVAINFTNAVPARTTTGSTRPPFALAAI
jgi:hypothetical protein